jgi:glycosyltransferase involved in cell wall biosynthesis
MPLHLKKAFVVTISHTGIALSRRNELFFLGPTRSQSLTFKFQCRALIPSANRLLWRLSCLYSIKYVDRLAIVVSRYVTLLALLLAKRSMQAFTVWTRDLRISLWTAKMHIPTICEVHKELTAREVNALKKAKIKGFLHLAPISEHLSDKLQSLAIDLKNVPPISILPMAATTDFYSSRDSELNYERLLTLRLGYFGSYESMGVESGIDLFIKSLSSVKNLPIEIVLVGIGPEGRRKISELTSGYRNRGLLITVIDYVDHSEVPSLMRNCHVLILPYGPEYFNLGRFPIKLVEYSASRIPILCSDTPSHRKILGEQKAFFYNLNEPASISKALEEIITDREKRKLVVEAAFTWASSLTYDARAEAIENALSQVQD